MKKAMFFVLVCAFCTLARAQDDQAWCMQEKFCFTPAVVIPGSHVFFDQGEDAEGEFDAFKDGRLGIDVQWIGLDAYWQALPNLRLGYLNAGFGSTAGSVEGAPVVTFSVGGFVQLQNLLRFEVGFVKALTAKEVIGKRDDNAIFVGISLPTHFGDALKKVFTQ